MAMFNSQKFIFTKLTNLSEVATITCSYFEAKDYTVGVTDIFNGYMISLSKGGIFKAILGMKTSLNIEIKRQVDGVQVTAKVGIFGQQVVPSLIMWFLAWPVLVTQISGLVAQSKLDNEAVEVIENAIRSTEAARRR
jgi:hypothetical protein